MLTPPNDIKAEAAVLGSILLDNVGHALRAAQSMLDVGMFYQDSHRKIYKAMISIEGPCDFVTLRSALEKAGEIDGIGGEPTLYGLLDAVGSSSNCQYYCKIVAQRHYERRIIEQCRSVAVDPSSSGVDSVRDLVITMERLGYPSSVHVKDILHDKLDRLGHKEYRKLYNVGFKTFDCSWGGIHGGEVNTWAAATNDGKSVIMMNIMIACARAGIKCLYFGTEMSCDESASRLLSIAGGPTVAQLRAERLNDSDMSKYVITADDIISKWGEIRFCDNPEPDLDDIETAIGESKPEIVFLDYLERFTLPREENMRLRVKEFMRKIKTMARKYNCVVHLASQLNRKAYGGGDEAPTMAEISESSAVEKESDRVILMYCQKSKNTEMLGDRTITATCAKNRHGRRGIMCDLVMNSRTLEVKEQYNV